jgi:hypothetical protein
MSFRRPPGGDHRARSPRSLLLGTGKQFLSRAGAARRALQGGHRRGGDGHARRLPHLQHPAGRGPQRGGGAHRLMRRALFTALLLAARRGRGVPRTRRSRSACATRTPTRPLDGAFVVAREFAEVGKIHGSLRYCVRADAVAASATLGRGEPAEPRHRRLDRRAGHGRLRVPPGILCRTRGQRRRGRLAQALLARHGAPRGSRSDAGHPLRDAARRPEPPWSALLYLEEVATALVCHEGPLGQR